MDTVKGKGGRPTALTKKVDLEICSRIPDESLRSICRDEHLPSKTTVFNWLLAASEEGAGQAHKMFLDHYNQSMELRVDNMFDELDEIAHDGSNDWMEREIDGGRIKHTLNGEHIQRSRLRVDTMKWKLSKLNPRKYGDKIQQEHSGKIDGSLVAGFAETQKDINKAIQEIKDSTDGATP